MTRFFNVAGPCDPWDHYMLPPERRLPGIRELIEQKLYFVIHAPQQVGKTTCFRTLAKRLTAEGKYAALHMSCEAAEAAGGDVEPAVQAVLRSMELTAERLPKALRPPEAESMKSIEWTTRLQVCLTRWSEGCPRPVVLFLDEIDPLRDESLLSVLRQLRAGYVERPEHFPHSMALIGLRDVRDYKVRTRPDRASLGTSSPFNIKVESLRIRNFTRGEIGELYGQHTEETGQGFEEEALELAWELTAGSAVAGERPGPAGSGEGCA